MGSQMSSPWAFWATFLSGAVFFAFFVAALFFRKFAQRTGDRFFSFFAGAFTLLALERISSQMAAVREAVGPATYLLRLAAFALIMIAVIDKNRRARVE